MSEGREKSYFASVWTSDDCNLKCKGCFFHDAEIFYPEFKPTYMTRETADAVIEYINRGHIQGISFFGAEPMLNWPIVKRILVKTHETTIRAVTNKNFGSIYHITTNGARFTPANIEDLALHDVHINLSFDGLPETQNTWRNNSYDAVLKHKDLLLEYPSLSILKLMVTPNTLYDDVEHIKELGFSNVFINGLDPFSKYTYIGYDVEDWKRQYRKVIEDLHDPPNFEVVDYNSWADLLRNKASANVIGCGYIFKGHAIAPDGKIYSCHQAPSLGEEFSIGDIWDGINPTKENQIRSVSNSPACTRCGYKLSKCYVQMYLKYGRFGCDSPPWHQEWERAKIELISEMQDIRLLPFECTRDPYGLVLKNILSQVTTFPGFGGDNDKDNIQDK